MKKIENLKKEINTKRDAIDKLRKDLDALHEKIDALIQQEIESSFTLKKYEKRKFIEGFLDKAYHSGSDCYYPSHWMDCSHYKIFNIKTKKYISKKFSSEHAAKGYLYKKLERQYGIDKVNGQGEDE